jgi:hypothetical protein
VQVSAGTTAASPTPFVLAIPGRATLSFTDAWPTGVSPSPAPIATSPSVILSSGGLTIVCSAQDTSGCPATGNGDTNWGLSAWGGTNGQFTAQPLVPAAYATYAGICTGDDPASGYGGSDPTTTVTSGNLTATTLTLPSIVVRLYSGTGLISVLGGVITTVPVSAGSEMAMPAGSKLVITDTQCNGGEHYVGGPGGVTVPVNDSALPIKASPLLNASLNDTGLLAYPGMPDGKYTVCYQNGSKYSQASLTNQGTGEVVYLYNNSLTTGSCAT